MLVKILSALFLCSLLFVGAFVLCGFSILRLTLGHMSIIGGGSRPFSSSETLLFWISVLGLLTSFAIHPLGAYLIKGDVYRLTPSKALRATILAGFMGFQVILLAAAYGVFVTKRYLEHGAYRRHREVVAMLDSANVEVLAKNATVITDDGKYVVAEVTLQINNVPPSIPYYEMNIHDVGREGAYFTAAARGSNQSTPNPYLRVAKTNGRWVFYDIFTSQTISDDAENVTLRFEFTRTGAASNEMPDTITPRLGIWAREDKVYLYDHLFFYKPIPVSFRREPMRSNEDE